MEKPRRAVSEGAGPDARDAAAAAGSGKCATGNSILGRCEFESRLSAKPVTQAFQRGRCAWDGLELDVLDTPDLLSREGLADEALRDACAAIRLSAPGPHAVLLVTQLGRSTEQDRAAVRRLQELLGAAVLAHTVLVFTRKEDLEDGSLDEFVRDTDNRALARLDVLCSRRHCGFDNRARGAEQEAQCGSSCPESEKLRPTAAQKERSVSSMTPTGPRERSPNQTCGNPRLVPAEAHAECPSHSCCTRRLQPVSSTTLSGTQSSSVSERPPNGQSTLGWAFL
ncbi:GTPase IMAP family member 6 [Galemys pyrenaicus]|uniref:GTPase IMAP family member 6 n=1 Tax=Galemys pyrenaicus TaxID=202257 RepID=A0A8J6A5Z9_GALPY|nr:GTPase IMAP family member 6 [Galemys pyrenaicus]